MKKFLKVSVVSVLVVLVVAYIACTFFLGAIAKSAVNRFGPGITQTHVVLAGARISPLSGSGTLTGLAVDNPSGWSDAHAFYLGSIHLEVRPMSIFSDHIVIEELVIDQAEFLYETKIVSSNIGDLLKNIGSDMSSQAGPKSSTGTPKKFEVRHFKLTNSKVSVGFGEKSYPISMPAIEMSDLGTKEGGVTADKLAYAIMSKVTANVVSSAATKLGSGSGAELMEKARQTGEELKKLFGK